jgi:pyruvate,water dikinase
MSQTARARTDTAERYRFIRFFNSIGLDDVASVGGKNASLGELYRQLAPQGLQVPNGFAVTADAYRYLLDCADAWPRLRVALAGLRPDNLDDLAARAAETRQIVLEAPLPKELVVEIAAAYRELREQYGSAVSLAVRSSATAEDLPTASFAGQHDSFLNIHGEQALLSAVHRCFASLFTDRAIRYRIDQGFDHLKVFNSVGVMKMVRSDLASSGVIFSLDPETGFRNVVLVTGSYGLGEDIVQGAVDPDEFYVFKPTLKQGKRFVLRRSLGRKEAKLVYATTGEHSTVNVATDESERQRYCITDQEVLQLADYALRVEEHYSAKAGASRPMDLEWAKDGNDGRLYIIQARPETVASHRDLTKLDEYLVEPSGPPLVEGHAVGSKVAAGRARVIHSPDQLAQFQPGEVLVADTTSPDWGTVMKTAAGIVTNSGGRTCHAAIVARELGIPAVVGTARATELINTGETVTVSCAEGDVGRIYGGSVPFELRHTDLASLPRPRTKIMVNLGNPEAAFATSFLPNDGVGLARLEFIIAEAIKIHPMALVQPEKLGAEEQAEIARLTAGYANPADYFVERLAEGVATIAAAFYPKPVIVRMSDFKTNEYASLIGGKAFEPVEANPMLGFRGASRYAHPAYEAGFALECAAMRRARDDMGFTNISLMIPFCRRVEEAERVLAAMARHGLRRGQNGLEVFVMCEIPNNVILIDAFAKHFDGFSIGSNDLTQLALGVDRDSEIVAFDFDERDEGVKELIRLAVEGARRNGRHSGICGQAPSDYPEMAEYLVSLGIDSISLNPDSVVKTTRLILEAEKRS